MGLCFFAVDFRASSLVSCKMVSEEIPALATSQGSMLKAGVESEEEEASPWRGSESLMLQDHLMGRVQET